MSGDTSGCDEFPESLVNNRFTATEHQSSLLVSINNSGGKEATVLSLTEHVSVNFISDFTKFNSAEGLPIELDGDTERFDTFDESYDNTLSLFVGLAGRLDHVGHDKSAVLVDDLHPLADLVLLSDNLFGSHTVSKVRKLDTIAEEDLTENEGRDLDSDRARVGSGTRGHFDNKSINLRSLGHGVERQETETVLIESIFMLATISHMVLLSGKFNPGLFIFFSDFQDFSVNLVSRSELTEFLDVSAFNSVETTDQRYTSNLSNVDVETVSLDALKRSRYHETFFHRGVVLIVFDGIRVNSLRKSQEETTLVFVVQKFNF